MTDGIWTGYMMTQFLTTETPVTLEPHEKLTLEERAYRLEQRVAALEGVGVG